VIALKEVEVVEGASKSVFILFTKIPGLDIKLHPLQYFEFVIQVALIQLLE